MYWNAYKVTGIVVIAWININMRCIEIYLKGAVYDNGRRLTLTWDVLKFGKPVKKIYRKED